LRENSEFCSYTIHPDSGSGPFNAANTHWQRVPFGAYTRATHSTP
jgi:hypothetical protein